MWGLFAAAVLAGLLFLYVPGFLVLRSLRLDGQVSVACAPLVTIPAYSLLTVAYEKAGVSCSWSALVLPVLLFGALLCAILLRKDARAVHDFGLMEGLAGAEKQKQRRFDWLCLGLYLLIGLIVSSVFLLGTLNGPGSFSQDFDNVHHLGVTHGYIESGNWSPFHATLYATSEASQINPLPGIGFYPAAWNCFAALIVSALGVSVPLAANAVNFLFVAVVFPSSMYLLLRSLFRKNRKVVPFGSLLVLAFGAFPWGFLIFGPLYPNMIAFAIMPAAIVCFMGVFTDGARRVSRVLSSVVFCCGIMAFVFAQPNAVFTAAVFLAPFCVYQIARGARRLPLEGKRKVLAQVGLCVLFSLAAMCLWYALFRAPFMQGVVTHAWHPATGKGDALFDVLFLSFREPPAQMILGVLVIVGGVYTLFRREYLWLSAAYAIAAFLYIVASSAAIDGVARFLFSGFWYTDSYRVAAFASIFAIPLATLGLWLVAQGAFFALGKVVPFKKGRLALGGVSVAVAAVFLCVNFYPGTPSFEQPERNAAFGWLQLRLRAANGLERSQPYDAEERAFVEEVEKVVPEGSLVLNEPHDGSVFSYAINDLDIYYRYLRPYGEEDETQDSREIRNRLGELASDDRVKAAVERVGAEYLLVLDQGKPQDARVYMFSYEDGRDWRGIERINDATPGFEVVLSRGDMRLYKIVGTAS